MDNKEKEFEALWQKHKTRLLMDDTEYKEAIGAYNLKTGADWLLFGIPVVAGIVSVEYIPIQHEILRWIASVAIIVVVFAVCVWIKSLSHPHRAIGDIEADIKRRHYQEFLKTGKISQPKSTK